MNHFLDGALHNAAASDGSLRARFRSSVNPRRVGVGIGFIAAYMLLDRATIDFQMWEGISAWYPPVGLGLAFLVAEGPSYALVMMLAAGITGVLNYQMSAASLTFWLINITIVAGYTGAAMVLRHIFGADYTFRSMKNVIWFVFVALAGSFCVALAGSRLLVWGKTLHPEDFPPAALNWWAGDAVALICLTPFLCLNRNQSSLALSLPQGVPDERGKEFDE